jgi:hypothetical protein
MTFRITAWLGVAALLVAGCSNATPSQGEESASASPPMATTGSSGGTNLIPSGTYTADIPEGVEAAPGQWTMEVTPDGIVWTNPETRTTFSPGEVVEVTSTGIVFAPDPQCPDQEGEPTEGSYEWSWDGGQLSFTLESDSCLGRRDTLTTAPWEPTP